MHNLHFLETLAPQISAAISNAALFERRKKHSKVSISACSTIQTLARTVETRDPYTWPPAAGIRPGRGRRKEEFGLSEDEKIDGIHMASIVHDIGKTIFSGPIILRTGKLSELEFALIKTHLAAVWAVIHCEGISFNG